MSISRDCLAQLGKYDTPTICNAIEVFDVRPRNQGFMNGSIQACFPKLPPMVGFALTTTFRSFAPPRSGNVYAGLTQQVEAFGELPGPAVVVFQDLDEPTCSATFGEVMCSVYKAAATSTRLRRSPSRRSRTARSARTVTAICCR
jgi:hypothetical protein